MEKPGFIAGPDADSRSGPVGPSLPPEHGLIMPRQPQNAPGRRLRSGGLFLHIWTILVRMVIIASTFGLTFYGISEMYKVMAGDITSIQWMFLGLFAISFTWISFAACQAMLGFLLLLKHDVWGKRHIHERLPGIQTAILVPIYNEDPVRISAAIEAMAEELSEKAPGLFAFFILSDTNQPSAWIREECAVYRLIGTSRWGCPVYYRHRRDNSERKAGNIADWVMRWGGAYEAMLVLDADSIMSPDTMIEMARRLEADAGLGLLQTLPAIVRGETLYARLQQFANRLYGPIFGKGLSIWHGKSSNFWGHNAIIRTEAFAASAHLPVLAGKPPFGGHVISHDFIEAALLRRNGWGVRLDTDLAQSYEEPPPSVSDMMVRDRRWCQGNLQHVRFLFARGIALASRVHLLSGMMAYLSALFWLLLLVVGLVLAVQGSLTRPEYFTQPSLFPIWPMFDSVRSVNLFIVSMCIVLLPKALGWLGAMLNLRRCFRYGGPLLLTLSVATEVLLSILFAPIMMLAQSRMVWEILTGGDSGWKPQRRDDGSILLTEALRRHKWHALIGVSASGLAWYLHHDLFFWALPITIGLVLSPLLSWVSGKLGPGKILRLSGILRTPEERREPVILAAVREHLTETKVPGEGAPATMLLNDAHFCAWHCAQLTSATEHDAFDPALILASAKVEQVASLNVLEDWMNSVETMAFLHSPELIRKVCQDYLDVCGGAKENDEDDMLRPTESQWMRSR